MVIRPLNRRAILAGLATTAALPTGLRAEEVVELGWEDLIPEGETVVPNALQGLIEHEEAPLISQQPASSGVRSDWNGQIVRLPGFIVPIEYSGTSVTSFILVPYVGACIHVPPPPANQLVFVTTPDPYESSGLFEPVNVTGMFGVSSVYTELAQIGYAMSAEKVEPYEA